MMKHPCTDCICFAICKSQMQEFLKDENRRVVCIGYLQTLSNKCCMIEEYVTFNHPKGTSLLNHVKSVMHMTFSKEWTE